jgi:hypothetical protein
VKFTVVTLLFTMALIFMWGYAEGVAMRLQAAKQALAVEEARVVELRARSADRDRLDAALLECHAGVAEYVHAIQDVQWQMEKVISTCPGRERPPRRP